MANPYWNFDTPLVRHTLARAETVNGVAAGIAAGFDLLPAPDEMREGRVIWATDTGAADAHVLALPYAPETYTEGLNVRFKAVATNTGATTANLNGLGIKSILRSNGAALSAGDILVDTIVEITYVDGAFRLNGAGVVTPVIGISDVTDLQDELDAINASIGDLGEPPEVTTSHGQTLVDSSTYTITLDDLHVRSVSGVLTFNIVIIQHATPASAVEIMLPALTADLQLYAPIMFIQTRDQTGAVTVVPATGGLLNDGTSAIATAGPGSWFTATAVADAGDAPSWEIRGDLNVASAIRGLRTFTEGVVYDNDTSGLTATTVQDAIDELKALIDALP
jgi:hypothetical protein